MNPSEDQQRAIVAQREREAAAINIEGMDGLRNTNDTLRVALHDLEKRQEELKLALEVARRERNEAKAWKAEYKRQVAEKDEQVAEAHSLLFKTEADRNTALAQAAALRRDAERWRWAKEHPGIAVYIFDIQWMEQRDFDAAIDAEMYGAQGQGQ
jgi:chromosome segregation ATPase